MLKKRLSSGLGKQLVNIDIVATYNQVTSTSSQQASSLIDHDF